MEIFRDDLEFDEIIFLIILKLMKIQLEQIEGVFLIEEFSVNKKINILKENIQEELQIIKEGKQDINLLLHETLTLIGKKAMTYPNIFKLIIHGMNNKRIHNLVNGSFKIVFKKHATNYNKTSDKKIYFLTNQTVKLLRTKMTPRELILELEKIKNTIYK